MTPLAAQLRDRIVAQGPLRLDAWMAACNGHYYGSRDPLGSDFTTAPEISQMFGELVGAWAGDLWQRAGRPAARLVELGPGRGTLMADALRVLARAGWDGPVHLVETSPVLRGAQAERLAPLTTSAPLMPISKPLMPIPAPLMPISDPLMPSEVEARPPVRACLDFARHERFFWHDTLAEVPNDLPILLIANEFFDALPIRRGTSAGTEAAVGWDGSAFVPATIASDVAAGETCEAGIAIAARIGDRLRARGGAVVIIDYGGPGPHADTLQAIRDGAPADPFAAPGEADLTAHVDFTALSTAAGVPAFGPVPQGEWLHRLGLAARAAQLKAGAGLTDRARIEMAVARLTGSMGRLFKALALTAPDWPAPAGFDE